MFEKEKKVCSVFFLSLYRMTNSHWNTSLLIFFIYFTKNFLPHRYSLYLKTSQENDCCPYNYNFQPRRCTIVYYQYINISPLSCRLRSNHFRISGKISTNKNTEDQEAAELRAIDRANRFFIPDTHAMSVSLILCLRWNNQSIMGL